MEDNKTTAVEPEKDVVAEEAKDGAVEPSAEDGKDSSGKKPAKADEPKYTQAELDKHSASRGENAVKKFMKDNGLTEKEVKDFKAWKDAQKTAEEKHLEELRVLNERAETAEKELTKLSRLEAVRKGGVEEKFVRFVTYEAAQLANEKGIDFDNALAEFMKNDGEAYKKQDTPKKSKPIDKSVPINAKSGADTEAAITAAFKKKRR